MKNPSRRRFLKLAGAATGSTLIGRSMPGWAEAAAPAAVTPPLSLFEYSEVQLLAGPLRSQFDHNHDLFLNLDEDALLKPFRQREGMPAPGPDMGGWYDNADDFNPVDNFHSFIPGHSFGQYLSGLARAYAVTGSKPTQEKIQRLVRGFAETVQPQGKFYVGHHLPAYTYDKTSCGLIDAHQFAQDPDALDVHWKATQAALPYLPEKALSRAEQRARPHKIVADTWDETYTLPENFFLAYQCSGKSSYRDLAVRFIEDDYFGRLPRTRTCCPANTPTAMSMHLAPRRSPTSCWVRRNTCARRPMDFAWFRSRVTPPAAGDRMKPLSCRDRGCWRQPRHHARQFRDVLRRVRSVQDHTLSAADHERLSLWRQHGARSVQHNCGRHSDSRRWNNLLLRRLQRRCEESPLQRQVALLLRNLSAVDGRLRHQFLLQEPGRDLCEFICAVARILVAEWNTLLPYSEHAVSGREQYTI